MTSHRLDTAHLVSGVLNRGDYSDIFEGRHPWKLDKIIFKRYQLQPMPNLREHKAFLNELVTFQITKPHAGFVKLFGVFKDKDYFYIAMEKMDGVNNTERCWQ